MKYYDYNWELDHTGITLDEELDLDRLGWKGGDYFKLINVNGQPKLVKVDVIEKFLIDGVK
jgi:hypothetical protein